MPGVKLYETDIPPHKLFLICLIEKSVIALFHNLERQLLNFILGDSIISKHITYINRYDNHKSIKSCAKSLFNGIKTIITMWLGVIALREVAVSKIYSI